jgi:single-strand DNA-binding protein
MSGFSVNTVTIDGNLTADPDVRHTQGGTPVIAMRIAHNERVKRGDGYGDQPHYFDVTVWGAFGEAIAKQVSKGARVVVSGRLNWREWEGDDGKRQAVSIIADSVIPVPRGNSSGGGPTE